MTEERIGRLQSLLDRIKRNAAKPKQHLGHNFVLSGAQAPRGDVAAGRAVPAAAPAAAQSDVAAQRPALAPAAAAPVTPAAPPVAPAPPRPAPKTDVAPSRPMAALPTVRQPVEELELDDLGVAGSSAHKPVPTARPVGTAAVDLEQTATHQVKSAASNSDIDNLSWSEPPGEPASEEPPPPDSSRRTRVASSMEEALASVAGDSEEPIPIKTPPPESGRQPSDGVYAAAMQAGGEAARPTAEQLGETLELEAPTAAELELDLVPVETAPAREELELELPPRPSVLEPPGDSAPPDGSEAEPPHRALEHSQIVEAADGVETAELEEIEADPLDNTMLSDHAQLAMQPQVTPRRATGQYVPLEVLKSVREFAPRSFLELLDASLRL